MLYKNVIFTVDQKPLPGITVNRRKERYFEDSSSDEEVIKPGSKKRRMTRIKTHEAAGEDGDESVNDGSVSDEEVGERCVGKGPNSDT